MSQTRLQCWTLYFSTSFILRSQLPQQSPEFSSMSCRCSKTVVTKRSEKGKITKKERVSWVYAVIKPAPSLWQASLTLHYHPRFLCIFCRKEETNSIQVRKIGRLMNDAFFRAAGIAVQA
ncbi:hypothetical protein KIN20_003511 [Parelaphostrongylus tenuis]|uniref:Uncharacterized protein n=1 Tax=Parelaphostrongylus tenuis TaxID=148309 RepID=A0AAD5MQ11_PARTN|nr:hypothetical protein KIN20_003511 [Parelaphostrongylus tenuis]